MQSSKTGDQGEMKNIYYFCSILLLEGSGHNFIF